MAISMANFGQADVTDEMMDAFVRQMEMEREERGGAGMRQYLKETSDIAAELGRVEEVGKTAVQTTADIETEAKGTAEKELLNQAIMTALAVAALYFTGGSSAVAGSTGTVAKGLQAINALLKGSKTARYATTIAGSLYAGGRAQAAGRGVTKRRAGEIPIAQYREPENGEAARDERLAARRTAGDIETATRELRETTKRQYTPTWKSKVLPLEFGPESYSYARNLAYPIMALLGTMDTSEEVLKVFGNKTAVGSMIEDKIDMPWLDPM
mgnify:FL=1